MAADAGLYGLDFSARAVLWSQPRDRRGPPPGRGVAAPLPRRPRRPASVDGGRTAGDERLGVRLGRGGDRRRDRLGRPAWQRLVSVACRRARPGRRGPPGPCIEPAWQLEGLALRPDGRRAAVVEGYSSDPGLAQRERQGHRPRDRRGRPTRGPVSRAWAWSPGATTSRSGTPADDGTGTATRPHLARRSSRGGLGADAAFIGGNVVKPQCAITDGAAVVYTTHEAHGVPPELARFDPATRDLDAPDRPQRRAPRRRPGLARRHGSSAGPRPTASRSRAGS